MAEMVDAIRMVTDIMGEISVASAEQATGVSQIGEAVVNMDEVTQQNAALVEQIAAAASSMQTEAQDLVKSVAVFKFDASEQGTDKPQAPVRQAVPVAPRAANPKAISAKAKPALAVESDEWETS